MSTLKLVVFFCLNILILKVQSYSLSICGMGGLFVRDVNYIATGCKNITLKVIILEFEISSMTETSHITEYLQN